MLQPDTCLQNRYCIECLIGQGGMGAVYRALDLRLNNPVALKHKHATGTATDAAFAREAQLLHAWCIAIRKFVCSEVCVYRYLSIAMLQYVLISESVKV